MSNNYMELTGQSTATDSTGSIPIVLITGFLGSGKTTLLRRIARDVRQQELVFLVNEFNARDIDGALLKEDHKDVLIIPGGSIFCRCKVAEFIDRLGFIHREFPHAAAVVIEASGMADPCVFPKLLQEARLDEKFHLRQVIAIVDPAALRKLRHTLPNILAQLRAADSILINKIDCASQREITEAVELVSQLNAQAIIYQTSHCDCPLTDMLASVPARARPDGDYAPCRDPRYATFTTDGTAAAVNALRQLLAAGEDAIFRVKGCVEIDGGHRYLDYAADAELQLSDMPAATVTPALVWIVNGSAAPRLREQLAGAGL
jgi:G3E family GTPase